MDPGTVLADRYQITEVIASGAMGSIYRARDLHFVHFEKIVAVKEIIISKSDPIVQITVCENFEQKANILAALSHRSIPRIFDFFDFENRLYLVMEYIHGRDLEAIVSDSTLAVDVEQIIQWCLELCDVLQYLHNREPGAIILRDLKPSDVMVNLDNHIVLVDFDSAKNFHTANSALIDGIEKDSTSERFTGEDTPGAEIYILGSIMHYLFARQHAQVRAHYSFGEGPSREFDPDIPSEIKEIIQKALAQNPDEGYRTIEDMKNALIEAGGNVDEASQPFIDQPIYSAPSPPVRWEFQCDDEVRGNLTCHNGLLLFGSYDQTLYALNHKEGNLAWKYLTGGGIVGEPCIHENTVYIGSEDHRLYALLLETGKLLWTFETGGPIRSSPRVIEGHVLVGSDDSCLHAIDINTNRETWKINVSGAVRSSPWVNHERAIFGCESGDMYCVNLSGQIQWSFRAKKAITSSPTVAQGIVFATSLDGTLYAIDELEGWLLWQFRMDKGSVSSPFVHGNVVYFGSAGGYIYAINTVDKAVLWKHQIGDQVSGSPVVAGENLFCGGADGVMYCLDPKSGNIKWKFKAQGAITGRPAVNRELLFVGSSDKHIYAVDASLS